MRKHWYVFLLLVTASPAIAGQENCKVKLNGASLSHPKLGHVWAVTPEALRVFRFFGFKPEKPGTARVYKNICPADKKTGEAAAARTFGGQGIPFLLDARGACENELAEKLGLKPQIIENFGSMDSGGMIPAISLLACTNGTVVLPCTHEKASRELALSDACPAQFLQRKP